ncbi:MAG: hypothetical protein V4641_16245 [Pseudomonadota bacterium]
MSENHSIYCAANGCPMLGSMSAATTGGGDFWCFLHFGCKPGTNHIITGELQRLAWLVKITQGVRAAKTKGWDAIEEAMNKEIRLNQSSHLIRGDHESLGNWLARLEETLRIGCAELIPTEVQPTLDV